MSKIAVIDIGSNTVRLVVFDAISRSPNYIFNEKATCRLGSELSRTGRLNPEGVDLAKSALQRFIRLARGMRVATIEITATAAVREAEDGPIFVQWIFNEFGQETRILSGREEGVLAAQGVLVGWPNASGVVCDIGGSSMELTVIEEGAIGATYSTRLGPLRLAEIPDEARSAFIADELARAQSEIGWQGGRIFLVGGSWRAIAKIDMARREYPFRVLHEYLMTPDEMRATIALIAHKEIDDLVTLADASRARSELLPLASEVMGATIDQFQPTDIAVSAYGLREGLLYEQMPKWMREADPLIAACESLEQEFARFPGYGYRLCEWMQPLLVGKNTAQLRLVLASCLLHDINWRYHPDYRSKIGFELVAHANFAGVTHDERLYLALANAARYENNPAHAFSHDAIALLDAQTVADARAVGVAMRLGAMISGAVISILDATKLRRKGDQLELVITREYQHIYTPSVFRRLESLGKVGGFEVSIAFE